MCGHVRHGECVGVRRQYLRVSSLLPLVLGIGLGRGTWPQVSLPAEPGAHAVAVMLGPFFLFFIQLCLPNIIHFLGPHCINQNLEKHYKRI